MRPSQRPRSSGCAALVGAERGDQRGDQVGADQLPHPDARAQARGRGARDQSLTRRPPSSRKLWYYAAMPKERTREAMGEGTTPKRALESDVVPDPFELQPLEDEGAQDIDAIWLAAADTWSRGREQLKGLESDLQSLRLTLERRAGE